MTDYVIVGAGLFGSIVAHELHAAGKSVLVIEKRKHPGGTVYTEYKHGIHIHKYGAHIFRTDSKEVWDYMNRFGEFMPYVHSPIARYKNEIYNLPFNMNTFSKMWNVCTPDEAKAVLRSQIVPNDNPQNLEEYALSQVGPFVYEKLIKGYTEKQWGVPCTELPVSTMRRIPIRFTYDNNYYSGKMYQGIPIDGYTSIIEKMLDGIDVAYNCDGAHVVMKHDMAPIVIYTGSIDELFGYQFGELGYRTLSFQERWLKDVDNFQGAPVVNYTDGAIPYTRIIEHKHFTGVKCHGTVITEEYPAAYIRGLERFYPLLDEKNAELYSTYVQYAYEHRPDIIFGGKLGSYQYTDMEETVKNALALCRDILR